jgi:hypothetical protein
MDRASKPETRDSPTAGHPAAKRKFGSQAAVKAPEVIILDINPSSSLRIVQFIAMRPCTNNSAV